MTRPRTPDLVTDAIFLSIVCPSLWRKCEAVNVPHTWKVEKGTLTATQRYKVEERPKAIFPWCFSFYQEK
jgi:hypothetical protein